MSNQTTAPDCDRQWRMTPALFGVGPLLYVLMRRSLEGSWDWMFQLDAAATVAAFKAEQTGRDA